jgi:hypothetical protein
LSEAAYDADGDEIRRLGVFVELAPWSHHIFRSHDKRQQEISNAAQKIWIVPAHGQEKFALNLGGGVSTPLNPTGA